LGSISKRRRLLAIGTELLPFAMGRLDSGIVLDSDLSGC
jgi:hypothetical protein